MECIIWGTEATVVPKQGDYVELDSPRAGGRYQVTGTVVSNVGGLRPEQKTLLTTWLVKQRRAGVKVPVVDTFVLADLDKLIPPKMSARVDAAMLALAKELRMVGQRFQVSTTDPDKAARERTLRLMAETASLSAKEVIALFEMMAQRALLTQVSSAWFAIAAPGWDRIEELEAARPSTTQAFVAMWFDDSMMLAFKDGLAPAIRDAGYEPLRIDNKEHINKIDDEIIAEIRRSRFLVADFTCEPEKVRGGVYFEAGFAKGLDIPVFWTVQAESTKDLHFDTRQFAHIVWKDPPDLRKQLADRIAAVIGYGPLKA
jgi:hypothetical protein